MVFFFFFFDRNSMVNLVLILEILEEFQLITMALLCFKKSHEILGFSQPTHLERFYIITNVKFIINLSPTPPHFTHLIKFYFFIFLSFPSFLGIIYVIIILIYIIINRLLFLLCVKHHLKKNKKVFYFFFSFFY